MSHKLLFWDLGGLIWLFFFFPNLPKVQDLNLLDICNVTLGHLHLGNAAPYSTNIAFH